VSRFFYFHNNVFNYGVILDAFDFYILHFVIHGTKNLHKVSPAAMAVNNENTMTVYFNLVADYLCNFLPTDPNQMIYPQIEASPIRVSSPVPSRPLMSYPIKQPKYLLMSSLSHQIQNQSNQRDIKMPDNARSINWRSETIMMLCKLFSSMWIQKCG
jgi:sphingomyelin phosphodiesterase 4